MADEVIQEQGKEEGSVAADLSAAFDKVEAAAITPTPTPASTSSTPAVEGKPAVKVEPASLRGEQTLKPGEVKAGEVKTGEVKPATGETKPGEVKTEENRWQDRLTKAPPSWKPEARESWQQVPANVRVEIHRRESEAYKAIQQSKTAREFHQEFAKVAQPFAILLEQEGGPLNGFHEYLKTASLLRMGTPHEKAMAIAKAVQQFQIPIEMLDSALAGNISRPGGGNGQAAPGEFRDPRVDQLLQTLNQQQQQREQGMLAEVDNELEVFAQDPANEYFHDVRELMADVLEVAARRNEKISLQQAYSRATMIHPEVAKLVRRKELTSEQDKLTAAALKARGAAISVTGAPGAPGGVAASDGTVRGSIEAAISQLSGR